MWRVKQKDLPRIDDDKDDVAVERLMSEPVPVVAVFIKGKLLPPLPYSRRLAHSAPAHTAAAFGMRQVVVISDALSEIVKSMVEVAFYTPRRPSPRAPSAPRNPVAAQASIAGENGVDWGVLTVKWDAASRR